MADGYLLSERDRSLIAEFLNAVKRDPRTMIGRTRGSRFDHEEFSTPESYLAKTPSGGIAAATATTLGSAICTLYRMLPDSSAPATTTLTRKVYNPYKTSLAGNAWVLVERDKFGTWYAATLSVEFGECA